MFVVKGNLFTEALRIRELFGPEDPGDEGAERHLWVDCCCTPPAFAIYWHSRGRHLGVDTFFYIVTRCREKKSVEMSCQTQLGPHVLDISRPPVTQSETIFPVARKERSKKPLSSLCRPSIFKRLDERPPLSVSRGEATSQQQQTAVQSRERGTTDHKTVSR